VSFRCVHLSTFIPLVASWDLVGGEHAAMAPAAPASGGEAPAAAAVVAGDANAHGTTDDLVVYVNGVRRALPPARAEATLLQYLRGAVAAPPGATSRARVRPVLPVLLRVTRRVRLTPKRRVTRAACARVAQSWG
jgi:hypothetical protein